MGWKDETRRALQGPKHPIIASAPPGGEPSLWFRPKKWGMAAKEAIDSFRKRILESKDSRIRARRFGELVQKCQDGDRMDFAKLTEAEAEEFNAIAVAMEIPDQREIIRVALESGIGEHNFLGDDEKPLGGGYGLPAKTVGELLDEWADISLEMYSVIQRWNASLGQTGSEKSGRSPGGSSTEPSSPRSPAPSPTEPSPSS